jgi:DNA-binding HxlR family transcriptional regulator
MATASARRPRSPKPGRAVRGSSTGRPVMALLDLMGRRWTMRVVWELRGDRLRFRELRTACGEPSPTILNQRLAELREAALVEIHDEGYGLTALGRELLERFLPVIEWSERWARATR